MGTPPSLLVNIPPVGIYHKPGGVDIVCITLRADALYTPAPWAVKWATVIHLFTWKFFLSTRVRTCIP